MIDIGFSFEKAPWELLTERLHNGDILPAGRLLALLEGEDDDAVEDAFALLAQKHITLDISQLPKDYGTAATEQRLRREEMLAAQGNYLQELEENDPLRLYLEEIASIPVAGAPQLLAELCTQGQTEKIPQLVDLTISRAISQAEQMTGRGILLLDLIQEASLGLWQGIVCYQDGDFYSHIDWWIGQYLAKAVMLQARQQGIGNKMRSALEDFRRADQQLLTRLGRNPTREEIAVEIGITAEDAEVYEDMLRTARLLEQATKPKQEDPVEDQRAVEDTAYFQSRQRIADMLSVLNPQEAQVLTLRFGLEGGLPASPQETAERMGMTSEQVLSIETAALQKLRTQE